MTTKITRLGSLLFLGITSWMHHAFDCGGDPAAWSVECRAPHVRNLLRLGASAIAAAACASCAVLGHRGRPSSTRANAGTEADVAAAACPHAGTALRGAGSPWGARDPVLAQDV